MKFYAVIDTNVIVSAMLNPDSVPGSILKYCATSIIVPMLNKEILAEYNEVLNRSKFNFSKKDIDLVLNLFKQKGIIVDRTKTDEAFSDLKDIVFFEVTLTGRANYNSYLVTGNLRDFPNKPFVVSPKEMISIILDEDNDNWADRLAEDNETETERLAYIIGSTGGNGALSPEAKRIIHLYCLHIIDYETACFALKRSFKK